MEVEVRRVGKQDCFASLPNTLLEAFLSDQLPSFPLVLELRVPGKKGQGGPWFVAWDGSASRSSHIEVSILNINSIDFVTFSRFHVFTSSWNCREAANSRFSISALACSKF